MQPSLCFQTRPSAAEKADSALTLTSLLCSQNPFQKQMKNLYNQLMKCVHVHSGFQATAQLMGLTLSAFGSNNLQGQQQWKVQVSNSSMLQMLQLQMLKSTDPIDLSRK